MRVTLRFVATLALALAQGCGDEPRTKGEPSGASGGLVEPTSTAATTTNATTNEETTSEALPTVGAEDTGAPESPCSERSDGDLHLDTPQAIEAARGIRTVAGSVIITGEVETLEPLECLQSIDGALTIHSTPLSDLVGLESLTEIGEGLWIRDNPNLESLDRLQNLRFTPHISLSGERLTHLGLGKLQATGAIVIGECLSDDGVDSLLGDLDGLESLLAITTVSIHHSPQLTELSALHAFAERGGSLSILQLRFNEQLDPTTIAGLSDAFDDVSLDVCGNAGRDPEECFCPPPP